jgi:ABC-type multidrug transport system permease subunit
MSMNWIILVITRGSAIMARKEQNRTLELLITRSLSSVRLLLAKSTAYAAEFTVVTSITLLVTLRLIPQFDPHISAFRLSVATLCTALFRSHLTTSHLHSMQPVNLQSEE